MKKNILILVVLVISLVSLNAQETNRQIAEKYLEEKGEVCFIINASNKEQFHEISKVITIGHKHIDETTLEIEAYADSKTFQQFLAYNIPYTVNIEDNELQFDPHKSGLSPQALSKNSVIAPGWDTTWDSYPTYTEYVNKMTYYANTFPSLCSLETIGTTQNGRALLVLKISDNVNIEEAEPEFFYTSSMHGNEIAGFPLMIRLIDYLLNNYGTNTEVTNLVNSTELYINPSANPDGTYGSTGSVTINSPTRSNASGQDLNRNYPDHENIGRINEGAGNTSRLHVSSTGGVYELETTAFMNFEASKDFVLSANFHGGTELVNYPGDNTFTQHPDHDYYEYISAEYATHAQNASDALGDFNYMTVDEDQGTYPSPGVTHGATWYTVYGGRQDYMTFYRHAKEVTIELSNVKFVSGSQLPNLWEYNKQAFLDYIKQANYGFQGTVSDASGNPIAAKISISGHDFNNSWVNSSITLGDYYRLIEAGTYNVTYEANGYTPQTISVTVTNNTKTTQNITLTAITAEPTASNENICGPESAALTASGTGILNWYDAVNASTPVYTGTTYNTPLLHTNTTYYVEDVITKPSVGITDSESNGAHRSGSRYLVFDALESVLLNKVTINPDQAGEMEIQLQDSNGSMLDSRVIFIENSGVQTIDLDFLIPVGTDLRLTAVELSNNLSLYRTGTNVSYPYTNSSGISIKNSSAGSTFYYFFYNWDIADIKSSRKAVNVTVTPSPIADFSFEVNSSNNGEVTFSNTSSNSDTYTWDFGDAIGSSNTTNPSYIYNESGTFDVTLTSTSTICGNDTKTFSVTVNISTLSITENILEGIKVFPNPFNDNLNINLSQSINTINVTLYDLSGRIIFNLRKSPINNKVQIKNLGTLSKGTYILQIIDLETNATLKRKVIK
jgi:PKD repeat protein